LTARSFCSELLFWTAGACDQVQVISVGQILAHRRKLVPDSSADRRSPTRGLAHLIIECVQPELDAGRYPVKRVIGDVVRVGADVLKEGHDLPAAQIVVRGPSRPPWSIPMQYD